MSWIFLSFVLIVGSVGLYLFVRLAKQKDINLETQNLSMFLVPAIFFIFFNWVQGVNPLLSWSDFILLMIISVFFSYLGNIFSLKGMHAAPNPGYSLMISKSYVILSTLLSVIFLQAPLTFLDVCSILVIIIGSAVIMYEKKTINTSTDNHWLLYTMITFVLWAVMAVCLSYLVLKGVPSTINLMYIFSMVSVITLLRLRDKRQTWKEFKHFPLLLIAIGIFSILMNYGLNQGYKVAPNPGFMNAVNTGSISIVTIASALFFKDQLNTQKLVGIAVTTAGLILLFIQ